MSSADEIFISVYKRTIFKDEIALKSALECEMSADQLFERVAGSAPASLLCVRGYYSNIAPGIVEMSIITITIF